MWMLTCDSFSTLVSVAGFPIHAYVVSGKKSSTPKPAIYLEGGIHAREWIAHATVTYMVSENEPAAVSRTVDGTASVPQFCLSVFSFYFLSRFSLVVVS
jgi:hypothetical protein